MENARIPSSAMNLSDEQVEQLETMRSRTPDAVNAVVQQFSEKVSPGQTPVFYDCEPSPGQDQWCFPIVQARVAKDGGQMVLGWAIWIWPGVLIEAEFHALWEDPQGVRHDIAPRSDGTTRVLFVPDPRAEYKGQQVNNIREPLSKASAVQNMIKAFDDRFAVLNRGIAAYAHQIVLNPLQEAELKEIDFRLGEAQYQILIGDSKAKPKVWVSGSKKKRR